MAEQKIELRKIRDFGVNINDTFVFLRQNLKPLLKSFFAICAVFMLGQAIFTGLYESHTAGSILQQLFSGRIRPGTNNRPLSNLFSIEYLMLVIFMMLTSASMKVALGAYIKYYLENNGQQPGIDEVWTIFKKYFFKVFLYSILIDIMIIIGCIFCLAPGIYLAVAFTAFPFVIMIEDADFNAAFNRCFEIIKANFWPSLALYLVAYIIYSFSGSIVGMVVGTVVGLVSYFTTKDVSTTVGLVTSFLNIFSFIFYTVFFISAALQYFSLTEQRDGTGILNRIDAIGTGKNNFDHTEEQY
ncbi:MAG TPA: hypothetical protein VKI61_11460 [Chitinophagaceae bacterium]|nr:hypothetical protein [Chitinophagaceae bacterium]